MRKIWAIAPALLVAGLVLWPRGSVNVKGRPVDADERVVTISSGDDVDLDRHLVPGKLTLFEYTAAW